MIKNNNCLNKNKDWSINSIVSIGFVKNLKVISVEAIKDGMPDVYTLQSTKGQLYEFIPHNGLRKI
jgi:hypothetical protein